MIDPRRMVGAAATVRAFRRETGGVPLGASLGEAVGDPGADHGRRIGHVVVRVLLVVAALVVPVALVFVFDEAEPHASLAQCTHASLSSPRAARRHPSTKAARCDVSARSDHAAITFPNYCIYRCLSRYQ